MLAALALVLLPWRGPTRDTLEWQVRDALLRSRMSSAAVPGLVVIDLDEASLASVGPWPWPRSRLADLVQQLLDAGATRVALDMVLPAPRADAGDGDARLAALAGSGRLVLSQVLDFVPRTPALAQGRLAPGATPPARLPQARATGHLGNHERLAQAARCTGNIGVLPDGDGRLRRLPLVSQWSGSSHPTLALALLTCGTPWPAWLAQVPLHADGTWSLPFQHAPEAWQAWPARAVLAGQLPAGALRGQLVLVGSSALGLGDRVATPLSGSQAGMLVHAEALTALRDVAAGRALPTPPAWLMPLWGVAGVLAMAWSAMRLTRLRRWLLVTGGVLTGWTLLAAWHALSGSPHPVAPALAGFVTLFVLQLPAEWYGTHLRLRRQTRLLSRYVAKPVMDELQRRDDDDLLEPRRVTITAMTVDLEGYTRHMLAHSPEQAAAMTRDFLQAITEPVWACRGTLDKYMGDGLMAFWGAPLSQPDQSDLALDAAEAMLAAMARLNRARALRGLPAMRVRVGLARGEAMVGDLGSLQRSSYTAVGDCVNLAARLQELARDLPHDVLCDDAVARHARPGRLLPAGRHEIKGVGTAQVSRLA